MFSLEPIMGLFTNIIPIEYSWLFFDQFFFNGWKFFNALFLAFLDYISEDLMNSENQSYEILKIFKAYYNSAPKPQKSFSAENSSIKIPSTSDKSSSFIVVKKVDESGVDYEPMKIDWEILVEEAIESVLINASPIK
jgi:hypothetical protein